MSQATIGLISDTHTPARAQRLPDIVFDVFRDVDLILHAGDVGELWVLDQLSQCAPVIAVHGNDETDEATAALPYLQTIAINGRRLVLTHAHYPDRNDELATRANDIWAPILDRRVALAPCSVASMAIFGHTHIPMALTYRDMTLINPGAVSAPNFLSRQSLRSVARLTIDPDAEPNITFFNIDEQGQSFVPKVNLDAGFIAAHDHVTETILDHALSTELQWIRDELAPIAPAFILGVLQPLARQCWQEPTTVITARNLVNALYARRDVPPAIIDKLRESSRFAPLLR